jgi:hypothetical protein
MRRRRRPGSVAHMLNTPDSHRGPVESGAPAVAGYALSRAGGGKVAIKVAMTAILIATLGLLLLLSVAIPANAVELDELTVVTVSRDGSWGVATAGSQGPAIAAAIHDCRAMAGGRSDCGAQFVTMRGGWVIAKLCGTHKIMVTAETRDDAEKAALVREIVLKRLHGADWSPCRRVLTVNPVGGVVPSQEGPYPVDARRGER